MKSTNQFPFKKARRISSRELASYRKAIEQKTGKKRPLRRGRPPKAADDKYVPISIRLHPIALRWLKAQAKKLDVPYQTIIHCMILRMAD